MQKYTRLAYIPYVPGLYRPGWAGLSRDWPGLAWAQRGRKMAPKSREKVPDRPGASASRVPWICPRKGFGGVTCGLPFCCALSGLYLHLALIGSQPTCFASLKHTRP